MENKKVIEIGKRYRIWVDGVRVEGVVLKIINDAMLIKLTTLFQRGRTIWVNMKLISTIGELN